MACKHVASGGGVSHIYACFRSRHFGKFTYENLSKNGVSPSHFFERGRARHFLREEGMYYMEMNKGEIRCENWSYKSYNEYPLIRIFMILRFPPPFFACQIFVWGARLPSPTFQNDATYVPGSDRLSYKYPIKSMVLAVPTKFQ